MPLLTLLYNDSLPPEQLNESRIITLIPTGDTILYSPLPTSNYGGYAYIEVGEPDNEVGAKLRSLVKFTLSSLANASIFRAVLRLRTVGEHSSNNREVRVYRCKRPWIESQATWNVYSTGNSWQTAGATGANDIDTTPIGATTVSGSEAIGTWVEWNLNPAKIEEMCHGTFVNQGFFLQALTEVDDAFEYSSRTGADPPQLVITYEYLGGHYWIM